MTISEPPPREVVRAALRRPSDRSLTPRRDDLYEPDAYGRELLTSLMRAQAGVSLAVLLPAISLLALYPLLTVGLAVLLLGERLTHMQLAGAITAVIAAILLSLEGPSAESASNHPA